jgi:TolB-like protein/tetratricopeptide (TPR) repeat protein
MLTRTRLTGVVAVVLAALGVSLMTDRFPRRAAMPAGQIRSVAVLPLANLSGDPEQEYFADGMTEHLIANLAKAGALRVIARTSVMHYKDTRKPVPAIARELNVDAIIEGSVGGANDTVRITPTLISGSSGEIHWTPSLERSPPQVLALQSEVARAIARRVDVTLTPQEQARLADAPTVDPEIHRQVLLGRHYTAKATEESLRKAVDYFNAAIEKDPRNALAYAGLAEAYTGLSGFYVPPQDVMPKARQAAETAIRLDDSLADAHAALGFILLVYDWDGPGAEKALLRALELNPTLASARLSYAAYLTSQARHDDGVREIRRAVDLDPLSIRTNAFATLFLLFSRSYDEAIELASRGLEFEPNAAFTLAFQGLAYSEQGRFAEAVSNLERAATLDNSPTILSLKAHVLAVVGRKKDARALLAQLEEMMTQRYFCPYEIGTIYVSLGDRDTAYEWFRKGTAERADCMPWLGVEPWLDPFRTDPRYATLLRDIGLTPVH